VSIRTTRYRGGVRAVLAVAVATPLVLVGTQAAQAAWVQQTPPKPAGVVSSSLGSVSCPAAAACMAIGDSQAHAGNKAFTETWDGTNWTIQKVANAAGTSLGTVSCTSSTACTVVGDHHTTTDPTDGFLPVAERWDGTDWTAQTVPMPPGQIDALLSGVSCTTPTRCVAVGYGGMGAPFSEIWNGTTWTVHSVPTPAGSDYAPMTAVSCRTGKTCEAVGYASGPVAWSLNGTKWSLQTVPPASGAEPGELFGLSCGTADFCVAVGTDNPTATSGPSAMADVWNGATWTQQVTAPLPTAVTENGLAAVSCVRTAMCTAVGDYIKYGHEFLLSERWTGSRFVLQRDVTISGKSQSPSLGGVSCPSLSDCTATGVYYTAHKDRSRLLAEQYQG
jgi:hypothetical protein